jgi:hypothetical protein
MSARAAWFLAAIVAVAPARADAPKKGAILVSAEGKLVIAGGSTSSGTPIVAGSSVSSGDDAHAEINLGDALVAVAPQTVFFVYGTPPPKGSKKLLVSDSTLSSGIVRVSTQKPTTINTPAGKVLLYSATDAKLHVESGVTRVSVHKGSAKVGGAVVSDGFGVRVGKGKPAKLPGAPTWTAAPKTSLKTKGETPIDVNGIITGTATQWHMQVAMNAAFTDFLVDTQLKAKTTTLVFEQKLPPGRYYTRVSAIDGDGLEGPWSAVAPIEIVSVTKP